MANDRPAFFIADAHLGQGSEASNRTRERDVLAFFDHVGASGAALFVYGDLFDFWFEYRHAIPKRYVRVLLALGELRRHGLPVTYVGGNHDFWIGDYLRRELDVAFTDEPLDLRLQGRRILLAHGDGMGPGDRGYKALKAVLRHPVSRWLYRWVHPDIGIPLAQGTSRTSRDHAPRRARSEEELEGSLGEPLFRRGYDAVVLGHFHRAIHRRARDRDFLVLGEWIEGRSVARRARGAFTLLDRAPGLGAAPRR
jgi:UDP-2,3-diacylglucosamine hydrolase